MNIRNAFVVWFIATAAFGQTAQQCTSAVSDTNFKPPVHISAGQGAAMGPRNVLPLFSENGIDFYGLDRKKSLTGGPIRENNIWIVVVFAEENRRETEIRALMQRIHNPNLAVDYAAGLKFVLANMELKDDRDSDKYKVWLRCSGITSSQKKCPYPHQIPMVSDVAYFQPQECITKDHKAWGGYLLFDDPLAGLAYTYPQYKAPPALSFQPSLLRAANMMLERFNAEDGVRK